MDLVLDRLDDAALFLRAQSDPDAFAAIYRRYERPILAYLRRRAGNADLAADLAAETFAGALASLSRGTQPSGEPVAWLFGIARIKVAEARRRGYSEDEARRTLAMQPVDASAGQLAAIDELAGDEAVRQLVATLPAEQREAVIARIFDDRDYLDIAEELELTESVVRKRVSRGLARLRTRIEGNA